MFVSLLRTTPWLSDRALALAIADDGNDFSLGVAFGGAILFFGALWLLVRFVHTEVAAAPSSRRSVAPPSSRRSVAAPPSSRRSEPPPSSRRSEPPPPASTRRPTAAPASVRPIPRRVIRLHAVTPGQECHEYNVGDNHGTRGSALIRVA